jgi:hypothetical protein
VEETILMSNIELHKQAFELYSQGLTLEEIAVKLDISPNTLKYWKSNKCRCSCGYHSWVDFKRKMRVSVPQVVSAAVVDAVVDELQPVLTAQQIVTVLEQIVSDALTSTKLKPQTWKELLETFKLILDIKRVYGITSEEGENSLEIFKLKGRVDINKFVNDFMNAADRKAPEPAHIATALEESLGKGNIYED